MTVKLRSIKEAKNLTGKKVFLRVDFNVAMKGTKVLEDFRIQRVVPTIKFLIKNKCQVIIGAHLGRPNGVVDPKLSLRPISKVLQKYLGKIPVKFIADSFDNQLVTRVGKIQSSVILLENLRFHFGEEKNDMQFAALLAGLADIYVDDAFGVIHREAASLCTITKLLTSYAGLNLIDEVKFLSESLTPPTPAAAIIGGIKLDSKFGVIEKFLKKYDKILVGGGVAHVFLKAKGYEIGDSIYDPQYFDQAIRLAKNKKIMTPVDFIVADAATKKKKHYVKLAHGTTICDIGEMILDIGPETVKLYSEAILKMQTVVCGGPMGLIDMKEFSGGTEKLMRAVTAKKRKLLIAGGGETIAVIDRLKLSKKFNFISTGGGSMLEFLEGKTLAGIKPLIKNKFLY